MVLHPRWLAGFSGLGLLPRMKIHAPLWGTVPLRGGLKTGWGNVLVLEVRIACTSRTGEAPWILFAGENGRTRHVSIPASLVQLLVPFLSYCRGSDPHGGSSVAGWLATSTRCLFKAAVVLRRKHDRSDLPPDPSARPPALNSGTQPRSCAPTCRKMTQAVVRRRGTSQATGFPGVEQRPRSRRPRSHLPACK